MRLRAVHQLEKGRQQRNFRKEILARNSVRLFVRLPCMAFTSLGPWCVVTFQTRARGARAACPKAQHSLPPSLSKAS